MTTSRIRWIPPSAPSIWCSPRTGPGSPTSRMSSERSLLTRQDDLAASEGLVIKNLVDLYRTLGGGWDPETAEPPVAPPSSFDKNNKVEVSEEEAHLETRAVCLDGV